MYFQLALLLGQTILFGCLIIFIATWTTRIISSYFDAPYLPTRREIFPLLANALSIGPSDVVYDLGCGDGRFLFYCAKRFPEARFVGIERNPLLILWMRTRKLIAGPSNITIRRGNIFTADISDATRIYAFLLKGTTERFFTERQLSDVRVVSRAFKLPNASPTETIRLSPYDDRYNKHVAYIYDL